MPKPAAPGDKQPVQETEKGYEIPVPKKADVLRDLQKLAHIERPGDGPGKDSPAAKQ